jgi:hypothetical protein
MPTFRGRRGARHISVRAGAPPDRPGRMYDDCSNVIKQRKQASEADPREHPPSGGPPIWLASRVEGLLRRLPAGPDGYSKGASLSASLPRANPPTRSVLLDGGLPMCSRVEPVFSAPERRVCRSIGEPHRRHGPHPGDWQTGRLSIFRRNDSLVPSGVTGPAGDQASPRSRASRCGGGTAWGTTDRRSY